MAVHPGAVAGMHDGGRVELLHDRGAGDLGPRPEPAPIEDRGVHRGVRVEPDRPDLVRFRRGRGARRRSLHPAAAGTAERGEPDVHHFHRVVGIVIPVGDSCTSKKRVLMPAIESGDGPPSRIPGGPAATGTRSSKFWPT